MSKKSNKDKKRVNLDVRPQLLFWDNYDYGGSEEGESEVSPGRGLYNGKMDKYDSIRDFIEHSRKRMRKKRKRLMSYILHTMIK